MNGIWVVKEDVGIYKTTLQEQDAIAFIPVDQPLKPAPLGRVYYLDMAIGIYDLYGFPDCDGLVQHVFHPLGDKVYENHPELTRKGLAQKIELATAEDLLKDFPEDVPIINDATTFEHLKYCDRLGITPKEPTPLWEYIELLR